MIVMIRDFSLNGKILKKDSELKIKKGFTQRGDIEQSVADALIQRGVAKEVKDDEPKSANSRQSKK